MKSINRKDFIVAGMVDRVHGTRGELRLSLEQQIPLKEWVFLEIQEKPVPFFLESASKDAVNPVVKLADVDDPARAQALVGLEVLTLSSARRKVTRARDTDILGYRIVDENLGALGVAAALEELPQQLLVNVSGGAKELSIPLVDEFIVRVDHDEKVLYLDLPEGMTDL